ncbi:LuxR family transcriptional regulator [Pseudoalteromonas ulvae UL12]|uniref:HTH luxR-type domain-containing protein n=1 Tax=Pseudoalteromonas ulvae TaxID=107327 RepID=A0A244CQH5_PSEDV|nr:helix-turn-helix transcriptional regulator [Pseudoalteromonas ulvae]MBE0365398.1 LuxR family transcriptional regulator [Pseudoalteromonas ulvae UL12]OUL57873.1 hypothetical protein B1199_12530 [Pseudoalteromonas ulvae]
MLSEVTTNNLKGSTRKLEIVNSLAELECEIKCIAKNLNAISYALCVFSVDLPEKDSVNIYGTLGSALSQLIIESQLIKSYCQSDFKPIRINEISNYYQLKDLKKKKAFYIFSDTLLIPFKGSAYEYGCLILRTKDEKTLKDEYFKSIVRVQYMYDAFKRSKKGKANEIKFTKREIECLKWATEGKTSWEISQILTITDRTVNYHIANCIRKTNSTNRQQAIAKFCAMGFV